MVASLYIGGQAGISANGYGRVAGPVGGRSSPGLPVGQRQTACVGGWVRSKRTSRVWCVLPAWRVPEYEPTSGWAANE